MCIRDRLLFAGPLFGHAAQSGLAHRKLRVLVVYTVLERDALRKLHNLLIKERHAHLKGICHAHFIRFQKNIADHPGIKVNELHFRYRVFVLYAIIERLYDFCRGRCIGLNFQELLAFFLSCLLYTSAGDLSTPGDLAVFVICIYFRHGDGIGIPVDVRHDHRVLIPTHADVIADAQLVKVVKLRDRCIVAEQQVADDGSVAEALRFVSVLREEIIRQSIINVAVSITINRMVSRRVCNAVSYTHLHGLLNP